VAGGDTVVRFQQPRLLLPLSSCGLDLIHTKLLKADRRKENNPEEECKNRYSSVSFTLLPNFDVVIFHKKQTRN
jgi:hypothetical protein